MEDNTEIYSTKYSKYVSLKVAMLIAIISAITCLIYFYINDLTIAYGDAVSRLNIARKIIDNLTPGLGQIGTLWLPFPHLLTIPLIWNDFLWSSALSGAVISFFAFIFSIYFIYKSVLLITKSYVASFIASMVFVSNINLLYLQTTAMSEAFFLFTLFGIMYYHLKWVFTKRDLYLYPLAFFTILTTLTRYEGYLVFGASIIVVLSTLVLKRNPRRHIEGKLVIYITLASLGIILWALYQTVIFKDPVYWLKVYTQRASLISSEAGNRPLNSSTQEYAPSNKNIETSIVFSKYLNSVLQINGIAVSLIAILATAIVLIRFKSLSFEHRVSLLSLLIPIAASIFVIISLKRGLPLEVPILEWQSIFKRDLNQYSEYNMRYGLSIMPLFVIVIGYALSRNMIFSFVTVIFILLQTINIFYPKYYLQYILPEQLINSGSKKIALMNNSAFVWFDKNYDQGLVLISALQHDPAMFYWKRNYKIYIHEGTQSYWINSIKSPELFARWIYMSKPGVTKGQSEDSVTFYLKQNRSFKKYYDLVFNDSNIYIYKLKPEYEEIQKKTLQQENIPTY